MSRCLDRSKFEPKIDMMRGVLLILILVLFSACNKEVCRDSVSPESLTLNTERLETELFEARSTKEVIKFLETHKDFAKFFLNAEQYPSDSVLAEQIFSLIRNPSIDTLYNESLNAFQSFESIIHKLEEGYGRLKKIYPQTKIPIVQTVVTGLADGGDLYISNDRIIIGMDFFIGGDATFKPHGIPNYILERYTTANLPAIILQFVSSQYVTPGKEDTMLSDMIDFGKNYYLLDKLLPCTPQHTLMGYTEEQWRDVFKNDEIIWANFIQNKWLYETNHTIKQKFLGERPVVYEIGDKCPGRIGAWLGWQIVNAYMEQTNSTIEELLAETDHNKIFMRSKYKPG